jgi:serine/threonine-protein kinase RsbW
LTEVLRTLSVPAELERLSAVRAFVRDAAEASGASERATADLVQAVDEAASNVIRHGYRGHAGEIRVEARRAAGALEVRLLDRAPLFDPTTAPRPDLSVAPLARRPGGMGIHLMTTMVDEVHHRPRPGGGNELLLVQSLAAAPSRGEGLA